MTGSKAERKGLDEALAYLRPGDTFVVWKLDRAGRSLTHLMRQVLPSLSKNPTHKRFTIERYISHCFSSPHGGILMNENIQQEITLACVTLLQKNAADYETARNCAVLHEPKTKKAYTFSSKKSNLSTRAALYHLLHIFCSMCYNPIGIIREIRGQ